MAAGLARAGWREPMGGGAGRAGRPGWGGSSHGGDGSPGARQVAVGSPPRAPLASAGEPPRSGRGGTSAAAGSSALCGRGQMSEIWRRK